jgi:CheY-like chemotaxis protein
LERPRVLLVDDTPEMVEYYGELLHADSYDIVGAAPNAAVALRMVRETKPQVVLLDISMPGMNGIELARRLRATKCYAALIFVSSDDGLATEAMAAGGSAFNFQQSYRFRSGSRDSRSTGGTEPHRGLARKQAVKSAGAYLRDIRLPITSMTARRHFS